MKRLIRLFYLTPALLCASLMAASNGASTERADGARRSGVTSAAHAPVAPAADIPVAAATSMTAKVIAYGERDLVPVKTKLRYSTLIVLPKNEQILDFTCGDKDYWVINGAQNFAYVKPAKAGAQTNLNLITASGNVYSFVLVEISAQPGGSSQPDAQPDLKVFVEPKEEPMQAALMGAPRFVSVKDLEDTRRQVAAAKEETQQVQQGAQAAIDTSINRFLSNLRFPYQFEAGRKPFYVRAMYHDDKFTYIQARPEETPTLYEIKDGKPNLVNFQYKDGVYVIDKILDKGYLALGKQKLVFIRQE